MQVAGSATETLMFVWDAMPLLKHVTLEDVDLRTPALLGQSHIALDNLQHLEYLSAKHLALTRHSAVQLFADLPLSLTTLLLDGTAFCDAAAPFLADLVNLQHVSLSQRPGTHSAMQPDVSLTCDFSAAAAHQAFSALTALRSLDLHKCCMPDETTVALLKALPKSMRELDISLNHFPACAAPLVAALEGLRSLRIGYKYESMSDKVALALAEHITRLSLSLIHI